MSLAAAPPSIFEIAGTARPGGRTHYVTLHLVLHLVYVTHRRYGHKHKGMHWNESSQPGDGFLAAGSELFKAMNSIRMDRTIFRLTISAVV